jgi:pterin-4a-carbinolamine dehydratase
MRRMNDRDNVEVSYDTLENLPEGISKGLVDYDVDYEVVKPISKHAERKATPVFSGVLKYFPKAIKYVSQVSKAGNDQHHPDKPLHWDKSKSTDEPDALVRHLIDHSINPVDDDGILHAGKVAWRALALLERYLDDNPQ